MLVETSGERSVGALPREVVKIVDVKCPDSGEGGTFRMENLEALDGKDEVKFVIASRRDYEFAREFRRSTTCRGACGRCCFRPCLPTRREPGRDSSARLLAEWILADRLPVRLGLQLHKFIWDPSERGV